MSSVFCERWQQHPSLLNFYVYLWENYNKDGKKILTRAHKTKHTLPSTQAISTRVSLPVILSSPLSDPWTVAVPFTGMWEDQTNRDESTSPLWGRVSMTMTPWVLSMPSQTMLTCASIRNDNYHISESPSALQIFNYLLSTMSSSETQPPSSYPPHRECPLNLGTLP